MKQKIASLHFAFIALILFLIFALNFVAFSFSGTLTQFLCGFGINYDSEEAQQAREEGAALALEVCREGFTLLKNEGDALPLNNPRINVFGWDGCDNGFVNQGGGSGAGSEVGRESLYAGLRRAGIQINEQLAADYNTLPYDRGVYSSDLSKYFRLIEASSDFYTEARIAQAKSFSDTALVVISRRGAEGTDLPTVQYDRNGNADPSRIYSELSHDEEYMLKVVKENFGKVIVLLNTANVMEMGFVDDDLIDAALIMYMPGNHGTSAVGEILTGSINPSGRTVDTIAYDLTTAPAYINAGPDGSMAATGHKNVRYIDYAENIYVGYYWYETADAEDFWDSDYAKTKWGVSNGYEDVVQYPFGYGLSYTQFDWTIESTDLPEGNVLSADTELTFEVFVENTGKMAGQDVVQLYVEQPYTKNGIEKAAIKLCGFAKTEVLEPGKGQLLTITANAYDIASYDCYDANGNGFMGYELEAGDYTFSLRTDVHTPATPAVGESSYVCTVQDGGIRFDKDPETGYNVVNRFTNYTNAASGATSQIVEPAMSDSSQAYSIDGADAGCGITYLTRADFAGTFPEARSVRDMPETVYEKTFRVGTPKVYEDDAMPITNSKETAYTLEDMLGLEYDDPKWDSLISQLSVETMALLCAKGGYQTVEIKEIGKPQCIDLDGTSGFNTVVTGSSTGYGTNYPCETTIASTWNWKLAYKIGLAVGKEAEGADIDGWYAPGANMHRSPLGGRNFEYFSEDPFISGTICAYIIRGNMEEGLYSYIKHFAANDSDVGRNGQYRWLTEQAFREIYLKPFEIAVKDGGTVAMMASIDRVGSVRATGSHALMTEVLRNEWGFRGSVITDYYQGGDVNDADEGIRAGNDLMLNPEGTSALFDDRTSATAIKALQKSSKNILYTYVHTQYARINAQGLDLGAAIGTKTAVFPWWIIVLVGIDVLLVGGCAVWGTVVFRKMKKCDAPNA